MSFVCPKCGGSHFGSSSDKDGKITSGMCHDEFSVGCRHQWDRTNPEEEDRHFPGTFIDPKWPIINQWNIIDSPGDQRIEGKSKPYFTAKFDVNTITAVVSSVEIVNECLIATTISGSKYVLGEHLSKEVDGQLKYISKLFEMDK